MKKNHKPVYSLEQAKEMSKDFSIKHILKEHAYLNKPLNFEEGYLLGLYTLFPYIKGLRGLFPNESGTIRERRDSAAKRSLAALCALHSKSTYEQEENAAAQIAGISAAIFDYDIARSKNGFLSPNVDYAIDNCGMGGDILVTPNVSTVSALIAAAAGITMCKHGSPSNADKGRHGSSDFVASMVLKLQNFESLIGIPPEKMTECVERFNFGYTEALDTNYKSIHLQTHKYANLPHMNDLLGPITNPVDLNVANKKIIGVNQLVHPRLAAKIYRELNSRGVTKIEKAFFVRGYVYPDRKGPDANDGMDELSILAGGTSAARLDSEGQITEINFSASSFGLEPILYEDIDPRIESRGGKGIFSLEILKGNVKGPARDLILVNTALIEHLAKGTSLIKSYENMKYVLESGAPYENALKIRKFLTN